MVIGMPDVPEWEGRQILTTRGVYGWMEMRVGWGRIWINRVSGGGGSYGRWMKSCKGGYRGDEKMFVKTALTETTRPRCDGGRDLRRGKKDYPLVSQTMGRGHWPSRRTGRTGNNGNNYYRYNPWGWVSCHVIRFAAVATAVYRVFRVKHVVFWLNLKPCKRSESWNAKL